MALLSITACGTGLNLQCVSTVVFAELHWTPGTLFQAEDRVHRMGQNYCVNIHYLIAQDTMDECLFRILEHKQHDMSTVLDGRASSVGASKVAGRFGKFSTEETRPAPVVAEVAKAEETEETTRKRKPTQTLMDVFSKQRAT